MFDGEAAFLAAMARGDLHARLGRPRPAPRPGSASEDNVQVPPILPPLPGDSFPPEPTQRVAFAGPTASHLVVVIRYEGPKGGPGMPEMLTPTSAIMGAGLGDCVAMLTDGRFSGVSLDSKAGKGGFRVGIRLWRKMASAFQMFGLL